MKLETYIFQSIFTWPRLYSFKTFEESKIKFLDHLFLTNGNGITYKSDGTFSPLYRPKIKFPLNYKKRILNGEKIAEVSNLDNNAVKLFEKAFPDRSDTRERVFLSDFLKRKETFYYFGDPLDASKEYKNALVVSVFPDEKHPIKWIPYAFSIKYCPLYDRVKKRLIPKESIKSDWREGIVYIFQKANEWFRNDEEFNNSHYNWSERLEDHHYFSETFKKSTDKLKLCREYEIPEKNYSSAKEMAKDISEFQRKRLIEDTQTIIDFYKD